MGTELSYWQREAIGESVRNVVYALLIVGICAVRGGEWTFAAIVWIVNALWGSWRVWTYWRRAFP